MEIRVGQGYDVHQLVEGRPLVVGGIEIPHEAGLLGHSDADVLLHAVTDAILGAVGAGDIGCAFPNTDPRWKDARSTDLLRAVWQPLHAEGWRLINMDSTIVAEAPKLNPHITAMRGVIADILGVDPLCCSIKATTSEGMGFEGRKEGISASAVVLLRKS